MLNLIEVLVAGRFQVIAIGKDNFKLQAKQFANGHEKATEWQLFCPDNIWLPREKFRDEANGEGHLFKQITESPKMSFI